MLCCASGYLVRHGKTDLVKIMRVFFALSLSSTGLGQNSSMAADQGKAQVCVYVCCLLLLLWPSSFIVVVVVMAVVVSRLWPS